jgi:hypothetical protein
MISLEQYANLCVAMSDTAGDESKEFAIAAEQGVSAEDWKAAKTGYTTQMTDPADMGRTAMAFMPLYQAALDRKRGGGEPCTLEQYTKIHTHMAYRKDPADSSKKIDYNIILAEHGFAHQSWLESESYWTPRVASDTDPKFNAEQAARFRQLAQQYSDELFGIVRD